MEDDETSDSTITIDVSGLSGSYLTSNAGGYAWDNMSYTIPTSAAYSISNIGAGGAGSSYNYTVNSTAYASANSGLVVIGDADFKGDVKIDGRSVRDSLAEIEKRLSILVPDPKKLEKYEALRKAYEHYKTLEAMCYGDDDE